MNSFIRKSKKLLYAINDNHQAILKALLLISFIMMVFVYEWLGLHDDDFVYMHVWEGGRKISSISDILLFQYNHFYFWGGRIVAHSILQFLFLVGKPYSSILNAFAFFYLAWILYSIVSEEKNLPLYCITLGLLFYFIPSRSDVLLWNTGFANYIWAPLILFIVAKPFLKSVKNEYNYSVIKILPLCLFAGWTNENMAPTLVIYILFSIIFIAKTTKTVDKYKLISLLLTTLGCLLLILAPGNFVRSSTTWNGLISTVVYRIHTQLFSWSDWLFLPMVLFIVLRYCNYRMTKRIVINNYFSWSLIIWYVSSILIFIASPAYPQRAATGPFCILLILIIHECEKLFKADTENHQFSIILSLLMMLGFTILLFSIAMKELSFLI